MKKITVFVSISMLMVFLSGCGQKVLTFSNIIEADQYMRNNIENMEWSHFQQLLDDKSSFSEKDFYALKKIINENSKTFYELVDDKIYRFNSNGKFLYMIDAVEKNNTIYFEEIIFFPELY